jgi:hypothetical protein
MPTPKKLAVLISLLGLGLPCSAAGLSTDESADRPDQSAGILAGDMAIRHALGLLKGPEPQAAKVDARHWVSDTGKRTVVSELAPNEPERIKRTLGLENGAVEPLLTAARSRDGPNPDQTVNPDPVVRPTREELLNTIKLALGLAGSPLQKGNVATRAMRPHEVYAVYAPIDLRLATSVQTADAQKPASDAPAAPAAPSDAQVQMLTALALNEDPAPDQPAPPEGVERSIPMLASDPDSGIRRGERVPASYSLVTTMPKEDAAIAQALSPVQANAQPEEAADGAVTMLEADTDRAPRDEPQLRDFIAPLANVEKAASGISVPVVTADPQLATDDAEFTIQANTIQAKLIDAPPLQMEMALLTASHNLQLTRQILLPLIRREVPADPATPSMLEPRLILSPPAGDVARQMVDPPIAGGETVAQVNQADNSPPEPFGSDLQLASEPTPAGPALVMTEASPPAPTLRPGEQIESVGHAKDWRPTIIERAAALAAQRNESDAARQALLPGLSEAATAKTDSGVFAAVPHLELALDAVEPLGQQPGAVVAPTPLAESPAASVAVEELDKLEPASTGEPVQLTLDTLDNVLAATEEDRSYPANPEPLSDSGVNPMQGDFLVVNDNMLDEVRGGFLTENGLQISFGIERAVYVNGNLIATTSLNVSDLSKMSAGQASPGGLSPGSLGLIQIGPGNTFQPGPLSPSSVATVIQNTLNNQKLQNVTTISATVNSLEVLKGLNLQSSLRNAISDSLRR